MFQMEDRNVAPAKGQMTALLVVALIVGGGGLGFGVFSLMKEGVQGPAGPQGQTGPQGPPGNDTNQGLVYYCASTEAITAALATIGTGIGTIIITQNVTLNAMIQVAGGGSYVIEGLAPGIAIECTPARGFNISSVSSCILRDLSIFVEQFAVPMELAGVFVWDSFVTLDNLHIDGSRGSLEWTGIWVNTTDVWISNCYMIDLTCGIWCSPSSNSIHISGNTIVDCSAPIQLEGNGITCESNFITSYHGQSHGIVVVGANNTIANNVLGWIVCFGCTNCTLTGNTIAGYTTNQLGNNTGIEVLNGASSNIFSGNMVSAFYNTQGSYEGHGIYISDATCVNNAVVSNSFLYNEDNIEDWGTNTYIANNYEV